MKARTRLGALQLAIMRSLWTRGEATVAQVREDLALERPLALTTIATMLRKMESKGIVDHRTLPEGRQFIYRPLIEERHVHQTMVRELTDLLFGGDSAALVNHLIDERALPPEELARLRELIDQHALRSAGREEPDGG